MPKRLRFLMYTVLLGLTLYMYYLSGQRPGSGPESAAPAASIVVTSVPQIDPLRLSAPLGVRRETLITVFERAPFNLRFDFVPLEDGRSRMIGRTSDGRTSLELIGPPEGVTAVNLMAALPEDQPLVRLRNLNAISLVVETALSDWQGASDWVGSNIDSAFAGRGASTQRTDKTVTMSRAPQTDTLVVTIVGPEL